MDNMNQDLFDKIFELWDITPTADEMAELNQFFADKDNLKSIVAEWVIKWNHLQQLIEDKISAKDFAGAYRSQCEAGTLKRCIREINDLLKKDTPNT